ncbi:MAG TPA: aminoglycoside phosphotransferase family protein [Verrucomicrobiae bacterium]|nr:aminoglycoside phosphotransferase family protein [Verrucomicrobiae bacterium]
MASTPPGSHSEARWIAGPRNSLPLPVLERIIHAAFPQCSAVSIQPLVDGLRNSNFKLQLDREPGTVVLRIYEHDPSLCLKELNLFRLVRGTVPVPEALHAEPLGFPDEYLPPFLLLRFVEGITFRELRRSGDPEAIAQAACSAGETLAAIGRFTFPGPGWLSPGTDGQLVVTGPLLEGADPTPRFVDLCLTAPPLQQRMPAELRDRVHALVWSRASQLAALDDSKQLVHCDFNKRNVLVQRAQISGRWRVAAVLDWEFSVSASPLIDVANFFRYERASRPLAEPHFSQGFQNAGGKLPSDWRRLAQVLDLTALCDSLTRESLPGSVETELMELVRATVEDRDPELP